MDSRASEQPWATGRSSGAKLLVDERLLARASSCTNMIPGERGRERGGRGRGKRARKAVVQQLGRFSRSLAWPWGMVRSPSASHIGHRKSQKLSDLEKEQISASSG